MSRDDRVSIKSRWENGKEGNSKFHDNDQRFKGNSVIIKKFSFN